jgi:hypothetical protein
MLRFNAHPFADGGAARANVRPAVDYHHAVEAESDAAKHPAWLNPY